MAWTNAQQKKTSFYLYAFEKEILKNSQENTAYLYSGGMPNPLCWNNLDI